MAVGGRWSPYGRGSGERNGERSADRLAGPPSLHRNPSPLLPTTTCITVAKTGALISPKSAPNRAHRAHPLGAELEMGGFGRSGGLGGRGRREHDGAEGWCPG